MGKTLKFTFWQLQLPQIRDFYLILIQFNRISNQACFMEIKL